MRSAPNTTSALSAQCAISRPTPPPSMATSMLSVTSWRIDVAPAGAEREARRDFTPTAGKARQHQVGDVRAGDQQHAADRAEEQQVTLTLLADRILEERHDLDLRRRVHVVRDSRAVAGGDDVHRLARLLQRDARPQSRDHLEEVAAAIQLRRARGKAPPRAAAPRSRS